MKQFTKFTSLLLVLLFVTSLVTLAQKKGAPWNVPANYKSKKSTVKAGDASINGVGKTLFNQHCKSCHGAKGLGDGPKAAKLETSCGDFSASTFQAQADGVIYYQSFVGRDDMPNFEKKIPDENDRWAVVMYIRTLKK